MRRTLAWGCAVASIAALAACGFARWPVSAERVGDSLNAAMGASPRLHWTAPQTAAFVALPRPSLRIVDARLDDALGANLVSAPQARLDLSLPALLGGRFVPARAVLISPTVTLDIDRPLFAGAAEGSTPPSSAPGPLASLSLSNGVLRVVSKARGLDTLIENVRGRLDGVAAGARLRFDLSAVWRGAPIAISGALADPELAARAEPSPVEIVLASPAANASFKGAFEGGDAPSLEGDMTASIGSLTALTRLLGSPSLSFPVFNDISVTAKVKATPDALTLRDATLTSAGQLFEGALQVAQAGGRAILSGTLAADHLVLASLLGPQERLFEPASGWSDAPFAFAPPGAFDLDMRLSAGNVDVYGHALANAAASVMVKDGRLHANLIEATLYGGRLDGEASVESVGQDLSIRARAELTEADFGLGFADVGWPAVTGRGAARFAGETSGRSPAAAVAGLSGSVSLEAADGAIAGVNLEEALRRSRRRPVDVTRDMRLGGTEFDRLDVSLALDHGVAHVVNGEMTSRGVSAGLDGAINLSAQTWDLTLNAAQTDAAGRESEDAAHLTLHIQGPWSAPAVRAAGDKDGPRRGTTSRSSAP